MSRTETWGHVREKLCVLSVGGLHGNSQEVLLPRRQHIQMHIDSAVHQLSQWPSVLPYDGCLQVPQSWYASANEPPAKGPPDGISQKPRNSFWGKKWDPQRTHTLLLGGQRAKHIPRQVDKSWKNLHIFLVFLSVLCLLFSPISLSTFALAISLLSSYQPTYCWPFWT